MAYLKNYRVYCNTCEAPYETGFVNEKPTICPNCSGSNIDSDSIASIDSVLELENGQSIDEQSTTSTDLQEKMSLSVNQNGTYTIDWCAEVLAKGKNSVKVRVRQDTTVLSEVSYYAGVGRTDDWQSVSGHKVVYLNGQHTFDIYFCSAKSDREVRIRKACLTVRRAD